MMMLENIVPLIAAFLSDDFKEWWLYPVFFGYFIASIPGLLRLFVKWR